jgi:hypothetical protein
MKYALLLLSIASLFLFTACQSSRGAVNPNHQWDSIGTVPYGTHANCQPSHPSYVYNHQEKPPYTQHNQQRYSHVTPKYKKSLPKPPKKKIKLKKVEDDNFSEGYMYPQTQKKTTTKPTSTTASTHLNMTKEECIGLIGEEKFYKYAEMLGSEAAPIKRCAILKANM